MNFIILIVGIIIPTVITGVLLESAEVSINSSWLILAFIANITIVAVVMRWSTRKDIL
jgi:hypothetical protein